MSRLSLELLAQARILATREPRRPKNASLRRAISTSYYALFHFIAEECVRLTIGGAPDLEGLRQFATRAFLHSKMKAVCEEFAKPVPKSDLLKPFWPTFQVPGNLDVRLIATNFMDLQEARHSADYDLSSRFSKQDAIAATDQAKEAMDAWKRLKAQNDRLALLFALSLLLWPGLSGR